MLNKIFLIQAHQYPNQLLRLINKLNDKDAYFYIHIDLKSDISLFQKIINGGNIVFIENRVDCIWGDFSQIQATINMIEAVFEKGYPTNSRVTLLSGQDYVIKSFNHINQFLNQNVETCFINIETLSQSGSHHVKNLKAYKINHSNKRYDFTMVSLYHIKSVIKGILNRKVSFKDLLLLFKTKKTPTNLTFFRGSNWFSFNYEILQKIVDFYKINKLDLDVFFKQTLCPDEIFFHTILMHLKKSDNSIKIMTSLTYDNWTRKGVVLPVTFTNEDLDELLSQPECKLFARKFDANQDTKILEELDKL